MWQADKSVEVFRKIDDVLRLGHRVSNLLCGFDLTQLDESVTSLRECLCKKLGRLDDNAVLMIRVTTVIPARLLQRW